MRVGFPRPRAAMPEQPNSTAEPSTTAASTSTTAAQDATSSVSPNPAMSSGLSTGILIGIGVVASLCALGLGMLAVYLLRRWIRQKGTRKNNHYVGMPPAQYPGFQLQRGYTTRSGDRSHSTTKASASKGYAATTHTHVPQELPAEPAAVELPAYWHRYR